MRNIIDTDRTPKGHWVGDGLPVIRGRYFIICNNKTCIFPS